VPKARRSYHTFLSDNTVKFRTDDLAEKNTNTTAGKIKAFLFSVLQSSATILLLKINAVSSLSILDPWMKLWQNYFA
jgi:hypothetical protein